MKALRTAVVALMVIVSVLMLAGCPRMLYYLEQTCKVYGTVTVAGSDPPAPVGSAEVFVGNYQYSELTNYYGDYELELPEGVWQIRVVKEGYEEFSATVEVGPPPAVNRVRLDVELVRIAPPFTMDGYWDFYMQEDGEYRLDSLSYFDQFDGTFQGFVGGMVPCNGTVADTVVEMTCVVPDEGGAISLTGYVQDEETVIFDDMGLKFKRTTPGFGTMEIDTFMEPETNRAVAGESEHQLSYHMGFDFMADNLSGHIWFDSEAPLNAGTYELGYEPPEGQEYVWAGIRLEHDEVECLGTLTINAGGYSGSFRLESQDSEFNYLEGWFELNQTEPWNSTVMITDGTWDGVPITQAAPANWIYGAKDTHYDDGGFSVVYMDADLAVSLSIDTRYEQWVGAGSYSLSSEDAPIKLDIESLTSDGEYRWAEAIAGTITITAYDKFTRIAGYFSGVEFQGETGTEFLSGSFDVPISLGYDM